MSEVAGSARSVPKFKGYPIKTGDLTEAEKDRIVELAGEPRNLGPYRIGRLIQRHHGTVAWFMYRNGLRKGKEKRRAPYMRSGAMVYPFTIEEDGFISDRRKAGEIPSQIAASLVGISPAPRTGQAVALRLVMLASFETATDDA